MADKIINVNFISFSVAVSDTPSKKTVVILPHLYFIGLKVVLRDTVFNLVYYVALLLSSQYLRTLSASVQLRSN